MTIRKRSPRGLSRRTFLKASAAAGFAPSTPWLPGCGDGGSADGGSSSADERERLDLHFDLSHHAAEATYVLHALGSDAHLLTLDPHTAATRAQLANEIPQLGDRVEDLTHFLVDVDLPADRVQHIWVTREDPDGAPIVLSYIHVSNTYRTEARQLRGIAVTPGAAGQDSRRILTTRDAASALLFHHPEIMRLDAMQAAIVLDVLESSPLLDDLADQIRGLGDGWLTATPARDPSGQPVLDSAGKPIIQRDPSDDTLAVADLVVRDVLHRIFNEPTLEGANWHLNPSQTTIAQPNAAELAAAPPKEEASGFRVAARYAPGTALEGIIIDDLVIVDAAARQVRLSVKNTWLRYLSAFVEVYDATGKRLNQHVTGP